MIALFKETFSESIPLAEYPFCAVDMGEHREDSAVVGVIGVGLNTSD